MKTFYVGIKAVIVKDGKVLILKGSAGRDFWEVPGGRIDGDESIEQALRRELREELPNIKAIVADQVLDAYRLHKDIDDDKSLVLIFYRVSADFTGDPEISNEHSEWKWANLDDAMSLVNDSCKAAVRQAFEIQ